MRTYKVHSNELQSFLNKINDKEIRERYKIFFSIHEDVHYQYSNNNKEPEQQLRTAAEALCKLLIFVYVCDANELFNEADKLSHQYFKVNEKKRPDYSEIKEEPLNTSKPAYNKIASGKNWNDDSDLGQLAYALLYKRGEKEDGKNRIYNKIKECYNTLYTSLNTDASHPVPFTKQSPYNASTLYCYYFGWVRSMIDLCPDKLSELKDLLPFENTIIEENVKKDIELEQLILEDESLKELNDLEGDFKHEYGKNTFSSSLQP